MKRQPILLLTIFWPALLIGLIACGEEPPPPVQQPPAVSKKIAVESPPGQQAASPQTDQTTPAAAMVDQDSDTPIAAADAAEKADPAAAAADAVSQESAESNAAALANEIASAEPSELVRESLQMAATYDPTGRFDPFAPLFRSEPEQRAETEQTASQRRERRVPQTPLERVALSQLKVTAIIRAETGNRALVEDATGKGYVVTKGTYVGLNAGRVIEIDGGRIVVEEEIENVMGELRIQLAELKLQKPPGEF